MLSNTSPKSSVSASDRRGPIAQAALTHKRKMHFIPNKERAFIKVMWLSFSAKVCAFVCFVSEPVGHSLWCFDRAEYCLPKQILYCWNSFSNLPLIYFEKYTEFLVMSTRIQLEKKKPSVDQSLLSIVPVCRPQAGGSRLYQDY